jgi:hypothetical protein
MDMDKNGGAIINFGGWVNGLQILALSIIFCPKSQQ